MEKFIEKKKNLTEDQIKELLYYYEQGINMGKEEIILRVTNNMTKLQFDTETISKILNLSESEIKNYLN